MSRPLYAIRPEPGLSATLEAARAMGLESRGEPLFAVRALPWEVPDLATFDGVLLGSANAVRHGGTALAGLCAKPSYVVGEATAEAARAAGFAVAAAGEGGLQGLLDGLAGQELTLLRIAGAEHVALTPPEGIALVTRIAYESAPVPMSEGLAERLRAGGVVLLHSAAAARHFADECERLGIARSGLALATLGSRIAAAAGEGWAGVQAASAPREAELLALARDMCH